MKKVNMIVVSTLILMIAVSVILLMNYQYQYKRQSKNIKQIPAHHTHKQAIKALTNSIIKKAKEKCCRKNLLPVKQINGNMDCFNLPTLKTDVNLALSSYKGWPFRVNEK